MEILNAMRDLYAYWEVYWEKRSMRRPHQGVDYRKMAFSAEEIIERLHPKRMHLRIEQIIQETPSTKTLRMKRTDAPLPPFRAGQYVNLFVDVDGVLTSRPYSISCAPGGEFLDLTIRLKPDGFVSPFLLNQVKVGDELESTGPSGHFYYEPLIHGEHLVFLAGGSGITPFRSILQDLATRFPQVKAHLIYGSRSPEDIIFGEELEAFAARHKNTAFDLVISEPPPGYQGLTGFIDAEILEQTLLRGEDKTPLTRRTYFICGPNEMYTFCLQALQQLGVAPYRIKREIYGPPNDVSIEPGWPEDISPDTVFSVDVLNHKTIRTTAGEPLLNALERYGILVPAVCRAGECSACRVRLVSGRVFQPEYAGVRQADRKFGYIHSCVSYPLEDIAIQI